tara:strand:- start:60 stop:332 length:273 start_codon:yes stop_codon:yes gene_type:complete
MNHEAIYKLYPNVIAVDDSRGAMDKDGKKVTIDQELVDAWVDPNAYQELRRSEYNKLNQDEMRFDDLINGTTTWVDSIKAIKAKYPKGTK